MIYNNGIQAGLIRGDHKSVIARKIYLSYPTFAFNADYEKEFYLLNEICIFFNVPFKSIQIAGSSKTGFSYFKQKEYESGVSDLDVAIIDRDLFIYYCEQVFLLTDGFSNLSKFGRTKDGISKYNLYRDSIMIGMFRPDLMPTSVLKKNWFNFFGRLSENYTDIFSDINAGIYLNEFYFEVKQSSNVDKYKPI